MTDSLIFLLSSNSQGHLFAATYNQGLFRSIDLGSTWIQLSNGLPITSFRSIAFDTSGATYAASYSDTLYRSTDNGDSWTPIETGIPRLEIRQLSIDLNNNIFAVDNQDQGVFVSPDNGISWDQTPLQNTFVATLGISKNHTLFAGTFSKSFKSIDKGGTWVVLDSSAATWSIRSLAFNSIGAIYSAVSGRGIYKSTDEGESWRLLDSALSGFSFRALALNSSGDIFAGTTGGVLRSTNGGSDWEEINNGLSDHWIETLALNSRGDIFAGTIHGVFRSTNKGDTWTMVLNQGIIETIAFDSHDHLFVGTSYYYSYRSTNNGDSWILLPLSYAISCIVVNSCDVVFAGTYAGYLYKSSDDGVTWTLANDGIPAIEISAMIVSSQDQIFLGTYSAGVYKSQEHFGCVNLVIDYETGWNLASVPLRVNNYQKKTLFPSATSEAFGYQNGYTIEDTLRLGKGYWLKFSTETITENFGKTVEIETLDVDARWNVIGSISTPISSESIESLPPGSVASPFFKYDPNRGYSVADTLKPGSGYWIKVNKVGKLILRQ